MKALTYVSRLFNPYKIISVNNIDYNQFSPFDCCYIQDQKEIEMKKKILITYYSETGHTRKIAEYIGDKTDAVVEVVETGYFAKGFLAYLKRGWLSYRKRNIPINAPGHDPSEFDLLIVGAPVWAGHVACPIRSYLATYKGQLPEVAFYVTMGGSGGQGALRDMREITGLSHCCPTYRVNKAA